jgi:hypothetical protein
LPLGSYQFNHRAAEKQKGFSNVACYKQVTPCRGLRSKFLHALQF